MGNKNFIEINGKKYDAITGKMISPESNVPKTPVVKVNANTGGVVDGFVRRSTNKSIKHSVNPAVKQPQKSQTLMRKGVAKPTKVINKVKAEKPVIHKSHLGTSVKRTQTAMHTPKSQHVNKYGSPAHRTSVAKTTNPELSVKQESLPTQTDSSTKQASIHSSNRTTNIAAQKMINSALANANSHNETAPTHHKKKKQNKLLKKLGISRRALSISTFAVAAVLLVGFYAVQSVPNLSMRVAATRAGFDASMPSYKPSGFSFNGPINYKPGQVTISFKSNTDNREYDVKQQASNWNSDALLSNFVIAEGKQYQTYLDKGRTLYIYNGSNATWVDDGIWYQIEGDSEMTTDQLIRIASSI